MLILIYRWYKARALLGCVCCFLLCAAANLKNTIISYLALQVSCVFNGVTLIL